MSRVIQCCPHYIHIYGTGAINLAGKVETEKARSSKYVSYKRHIWPCQKRRKSPSWRCDGSRHSQQEQKFRCRRKKEQELMNLYGGVTFHCCSPFLTEDTVIKLHLQSWASQREDQYSHYPGYSGLLDLKLMMREPNLKMQSPDTPHTKYLRDVAAAV